MRNLAIATVLLMQMTCTAAHADSTVERIREQQRIVVAHRESSIPFSYLDDKGKPVGYAIDICMHIVAAVRRELKLPRLDVAYLPVTPATRTAAITQGRADLECGSTTNTAERRRDVAFSIPYFIATARALVRADSGIRNWSGLRGRKVVTTTGTTNAQTLADRDKVRSLNISLMESKDHADGFSMVERREADAFAMDDVLLYGLRATAAKPSDFTVIGDPLSVEPYAVMLNRDDTAFKQIVDREIARLMHDGDIDALYDKWFNRPIPPKGVNMNMPMSPLLRTVIRYPGDKF